MDFVTSITYYRLGKIETQEIPLLATNALEQGYDSPSLRILAGLLPGITSKWEIDSYLKSTMKELKIEETSQGVTCFVIIRYFLEQIVDEEISPVEGLKKIVDSVFNTTSFQQLRLHEMNKKYANDYFEFNNLYSLYYQSDDLYNTYYSGSKKYKLSELEISNSIIEEAKIYLNKYEKILNLIIAHEKFLGIIKNIKGKSSDSCQELVERISNIILKFGIVPIICESRKKKSIFGKLKKYSIGYVMNKEMRIILYVVIIEENKIFMIEDINLKVEV